MATADPAISESEELSDPVSSLRRAWLQEKFSPELLAYRTSLLHALALSIDAQQQGPLAAQVEDALQAFRNNLIQLELDRVHYLIASYLRIRLQKVSLNQEKRKTKKKKF